MQSVQVRSTDFLLQLVLARMNADLNRCRAGFAQATTAKAGEARKRAMSRSGGSPKWRRYSRLNCDGLS
jgi:hypothetical protein